MVEIIATPLTFLQTNVMIRIPLFKRADEQRMYELQWPFVDIYLHLISLKDKGLRQYLNFILIFEILIRTCNYDGQSNC